MVGVFGLTFYVQMYHVLTIKLFYFYECVSNNFKIHYYFVVNAVEW